MQITRMFNHAITSIGRNNANIHRANISDFILMRLTHGTGMKSGDLIVVHIGGDEGLTSIAALNGFDVRGVHVMRLHPFKVWSKIFTNGGHWNGIGA